jgi:hypothetical protein
VLKKIRRRIDRTNNCQCEQFSKKNCLGEELSSQRIVRAKNCPAKNFLSKKLSGEKLSDEELPDEEFSSEELCGNPFYVFDRF